MYMYREEVMDKAKSFTSWHEAQIANPYIRNLTTMSDEKNVFDIEFEPAPEKGKPCHMQVDEDLHRWLNGHRIQKGVTFRKLANQLLCLGIQEYIKAKKLGDKIRNRSK